MIYQLEVRRPIITRSRALKIASAKEDLKKAIAPIGGVISGVGDACVIIRFNHKTSTENKTEMLGFEILNDCFKVKYCNFHPYGKQTYFKKHYGNNNTILNAVESYLRSKGATYVL